MSSARCFFLLLKPVFKPVFISSIVSKSILFLNSLRSKLMTWFILRMVAGRLLKAFSFSVLLVSSYSSAIGISELTVSSAVGERFYGLITVTGADNVSSNDMLVSLAPRSVYRAMGVEWEYFHTRLIFDVITDDQNQHTIRVVSTDAVFEPYLDFVVSLRSPAGSISKQLTVLLEMPAVLVQPFVNSKVISKASSKASSKAIKPTKTAKPKKKLNKIQRTPIINQEVKAKSSPDLEAKEPLRSDSSQIAKDKVEAEAEAEAVEFKEPQALQNQGGAVETLSANASGYQHQTKDHPLEDRPLEYRPLEGRPFEDRQPADKPDQQAVNNDKLTVENWSHKTRSGDSLWAVARRVHAQKGGNIKPIVDALYQNNPHAFIKNDADRLKVNARLAVSAAQINAVIAANKLSDNASEIESLDSPPINIQPVDTILANEEGVLSLVTIDDNNAPVAAETVELSERSEELSNDFDKGLTGSKERELNVEARMDNLYLQYEALSAKTEQLKALEASLNRSIADKSQLNLALDEPLTLPSEAANENLRPLANDATNNQHLLFVILGAGSLLLLLVLLLKRGQIRRRALDVDNWSLEAESINSLKSEGLVNMDQQIDDDCLAIDTPDDSSALDISLSNDSENDNEASNESLIDNDIIDASTAIDANTDATDDPLPIPAEGAVELEASVYIAYERYDEAEDLLEQALEIDSDNQALQMQLLEVYAAKGKVRHFDLLANQINDDDNDRITIKINYLKSKI